MVTTAEARALEIRKFNRFYTNFIGLVNQTILESPYSLAEVRVLLEIRMAGECTASDLIKILQIDPGYLSRIVRRFKKEYMITNAKSLIDGRAKLLSLTDKGKGIIDELSDASTRQITTILEKLPDNNQRQLISFMGTVQAILSRQEDTPVVIRSQKPGDAGYIAYRHAVLYQQEYGLGEVFEQYVLAGIAKFLETRPGGDIWVAEFGGQIVGSIAIVRIDQETAQLRWFLIEPEFRGSGLGRRLVGTAMDYCKQQGIKQVFLWTFRGLDAARHLYESFGFKLTQQVENNTWNDGLIEQKWETILGE